MATVNSFEEIQNDFLASVARIVWCNLATVDTRGRPRSRVLHPTWEDSTGWIMTGRQSFKTKHLAENPHVSLAYVAEPFTPVYVEATAEWIDDSSEKKRVWDLFKNTPEPYGYDPTPYFGSPDSKGFGVLKIVPRRIELYDLMSNASRVWKA
jgi:general stress protein 26